MHVPGSSAVESKFWWLRHDWINYKVPVEEGRIILPEDYLATGFGIDPLQHWYSFIHDRKDRRKIADFSEWAGGTLFINQRAYETFKDILLRHGRAFPVRCSNMPHYIVLIDRMHDAIDMGRSAFVRCMDNDGPIEEDISQIRKIALVGSFSSEDDIFRIDRGFALSQEIIVSYRFKARYEASGLTGLLFKSTEPEQ